MNPKVDFYFAQSKWPGELSLLRNMVLDCGLTEVLKWGCPCYQYGDRNIVLIHEFKEYCALLFFKGALLTDAHNVLIQQTERVQAARQMRFTSVAQVKKQKTVVQQYVSAAVAVEKSGLKVPAKATAAYAVPVELEQKMEEQPALRIAFNALTPGRQRGYLLHFAGAKKAETRVARVAKYIPHIMQGRGLED